MARTDDAHRRTSMHAPTECTQHMHGTAARYAWPVYQHTKRCIYAAQHDAYPHKRLSSVVHIMTCRFFKFRVHLSTPQLHHVLSSCTSTAHITFESNPTPCIAMTHVLYSHQICGSTLVLTTVASDALLGILCPCNMQPMVDGLALQVDVDQDIVVQQVRVHTVVLCDRANNQVQAQIRDTLGYPDNGMVTWHLAGHWHRRTRRGTSGLVQRRAGRAQVVLNQRSFFFDQQCGGHVCPGAQHSQSNATPKYHSHAGHGLHRSTHLPDPGAVQHLAGAVSLI